MLKINLTVTVTNSNLFYFNMNFLKDSDLEFSEIIKKRKKKTFSMVVFIWMIIILKLFHMVISYNTLTERSQKRHTLV